MVLEDFVGKKGVLDVRSCKSRLPMISDCNVKLALIHFTKMKQIHSDYMVNFCQDIKRKLNLKWFETTKNKNLKRVEIT